MHLIRDDEAMRLLRVFIENKVENMSIWTSTIKKITGDLEQ